MLEPPTLCRRCGLRPVPPRRGNVPGRPRTTCEVCQPYRPLTGDALLRQREAVRRSRRRAKKPVDPMAQIREGVLCGCGRDYAAVPLEDSHVCPHPVRNG